MRGLENEKTRKLQSEGCRGGPKGESRPVKEAQRAMGGRKKGDRARALSAQIEDLETDLPDFDTLIEPTDNSDSRPIRDRLGMKEAVFCHREPGKRLITFDARKVKVAVDQIKAMPSEAESLHMVVGQEFCGFDLLPAFLALTGKPCFERLYLTSLGFSRDNMGQLKLLIEEKAIDPKRLKILCGDFFRRADSGQWDMGKLLAKEHGFTFRSFRNHTKLVLAELGGCFYVVESSANLRSCSNIEQFCLSQSKGLWEFHAGWIEEVLKVSHD